MASYTKCYIVDGQKLWSSDMDLYGGKMRDGKLTCSNTPSICHSRDITQNYRGRHPKPILRLWWPLLKSRKSNNAQPSNSRC